jgi:hypothetical protein
MEAGAHTATIASARRTPRYAVGLRVLTDRGLLRQIREELRARAMELSDIARLENVSEDVLLGVLEAPVSPAEEPSVLLREFAACHDGYSTAAWRTTRHRFSKRHVLDAGGVALCGTPLGVEREVLDSGPCRTCAEHAGIKLVCGPAELACA